jgi:hypothetical protein
MPKNTRRVTVTRTVTFTTTIDTPGYPEETNANMLTLLGGAAGNTGTLAIGELLSGADLANAGVVSRGNWSVTGTPTNIEPYITRPQNTPLTLGQRVVSVRPRDGQEAARGKLFFVSVAGTTANITTPVSNSTECSWTLTDGNTTSDGTVVYRTLPKFPTLTTFVAATVYAVGTILRPNVNSQKEFLVTTATTASTTTPTWTNLDTLGAASSLPGAGAVICIAGAVTYAFQTQYALGDIVKPNSGSAEEYLVTVAGRSDTTALTATFGSTVVRGTVSFKRVV